MSKRIVRLRAASYLSQPQPLLCANATQAACASRWPAIAEDWGPNILPVEFDQVTESIAMEFRMKAADVMTSKVISTGPKASIKDAAKLMLQYRISGLPVLDDQKRIVGIVTEGDFLRRAETGTVRQHPRWLEFMLGPGKLADEYVHAFGRKIEEIMTPDPICISQDMPLEEVVRTMEKHRVKRLPVVTHGRVVGIVSRANLVQALASLLPESKDSHSNDAEIRNRIMAEMAKRPWSPGNLVNVVVRGGVAELWGTIVDDRERQALKVAAENVDGVKAVKDHILFVEPLSGMFFEGEDDKSTT